MKIHCGPVSKDQSKSNLISFSLQHERTEILHRADELEAKPNGPTEWKGASGWTHTAEILLFEEH